MSQFHFTPDSYLEMIRADVECFDAFQEALADATRGVDAQRVLELGTGTGETSRQVLQHHPDAKLVGIDESKSMLEHARRTLPEGTELRVSRLQEELPAGPFELVFSALTVHHLDAAEKANLFRRIGTLLIPGGLFVLGDVVVPERPEDAVTPVTEGFDLPDSVADQIDWLAEAGFRAHTTWSWKDLAVISAEI